MLMLVCLVTAFQHSAAKHFNFLGQGTPSPVNPLAYGMKGYVPTAKVF
jgi:hypothetical protein